jgi:Ser/Thr protein kinase RdoA (MazF antagonist)
MSAPRPASVPDEGVAARIAARALGTGIVAVERFATGRQHWVYAVRGADGREAVIRLNRPDTGPIFAGAIAWNRLLRPLGVPLPALLAHDTAPADGDYPYMLLERLPGRDLGTVYPTLSATEKRALVGRLAAIGAIVGALPHGPGFGYATSYDDPQLYSSWTALLRGQIQQNRARIVAAGVADPRYADRVAARLETYSAYLDAVTPAPFLDDTTTKNVLIADGRLSGIVDADYLCFGDRLLTVALTRMSLLSRGWATDYIDFWCAALGPGAAPRPILDLYTALCGVGFLAELGHADNRAVAAPVDAAYLAHLVQLLDGLLARAPCLSGLLPSG